SLDDFKVAIEVLIADLHIVPALANGLKQIGFVVAVVRIPVIRGQNGEEESGVFNGFEHFALPVLSDADVIAIAPEFGFEAAIDQRGREQSLEFLDPVEVLTGVTDEDVL